MHEQLDGCLAALQALGDNPGTIKKDEAATSAVQGAAFGACHNAPKTQAGCRIQTRIRLQSPQAGLACAPPCGQGHGQSGALAPRRGRPAAAIRCPPRARGPPAAA
eukprot:2122798-Pleurochrysis_carterae.AAC.1